MRIDAAVAREAKAMTTRDVIVKAIEGKLSWVQAADILGYTPRHMRRLKTLWLRQGYDGIRDQRGVRPRRRRIPLATIRALCALKRRQYPDFSIRHFWERATEQHGFTLSYTWTRLVLQAAGLAPKAPARGKYRRKRERRPMIGMLVHLDASTHRWITGCRCKTWSWRSMMPTGGSWMRASCRRRARRRRSPASTPY